MIAAEIAGLVDRATAGVSDLRLRFALAHLFFGKVLKELTTAETTADIDPTAISPFFEELRMKIAAPLKRLNGEAKEQFAHNLSAEIRQALSSWQIRNLTSAEPGDLPQA